MKPLFCYFIHWKLIVEGEHNLGILSKVLEVVVVHAEQDITFQSILVARTNCASNYPEDLGYDLLFCGHGTILGDPDGKGHPKIE